MRITLVLGSGGARGYAHIGVIDELLERGHEVVAVSGCSMGAVVGGALAAGRLEEFRAAVGDIDFADIIRLAEPTLRAPGLLRAGRLMDLLEKTIGDVRIEDLPTPFTAVATDIVNRREVWFHKGSLLTAIRASIAIPAVFTPVVVHGRLLCDGGVLNPLPIEPAAMYPSDGVVAVSLSGRDAVFGQGAPVADEADEAHEPGWADRIRERTAALIEDSRVKAASLLEDERLQGLRDLLPGGDDSGSWSDRPQEKLPKGVDRLDMMTMSLDAMSSVIEATRTANMPPDVLVSIPSAIGDVFDFQRSEEFIRIGRERAKAAFDQVGL